MTPLTPADRKFLVITFVVAVVFILLSFVPLYAQFLIDRDSESWGYPAGGVKLTERLVTQVNKVQRFNPAVVAEKNGLSNVKLYIQFPPTVQVNRGRAWRQTHAGMYLADLGAINPDTFSNAFEALEFKALVSGTLRLPYMISAYERRPKTGEIEIEVCP